MAEKVQGNTKNTLLKMMFIIHIVSVAVFLLMMLDTVSISGGPFVPSLDNFDFFANCLRIIADIMILTGFMRKRHNGPLMWGFLLNIISQTFDLIVHGNGMRTSMISALAFVATLFLIVFFTLLTMIVVTDTSRDETYMFTKVTIVGCVFFWLVSDIVNFTVVGMQGLFTVIFLIAEFIQMATLVVWGILFTDMLKPEKESEET